MTRSKKVPKLTLQEAAAEASRRRLGLSRSYAALSRDILEALDELAARTAWRQASSSTRAGHSHLYAFHRALQNAEVHLFVPQSPELDRARELTRYAWRFINDFRLGHVGQQQRVTAEDHARLLEAAERFHIVADAYEAAGDHRNAAQAVEIARSLAAAARLAASMSPA